MFVLSFVFFSFLKIKEVYSFSSIDFTWLYFVGLLPIIINRWFAFTKWPNQLWWSIYFNFVKFFAWGNLYWMIKLFVIQIYSNFRPRISKIGMNPNDIPNNFFKFRTFFTIKGCWKIDAFAFNWRLFRFLQWGAILAARNRCLVEW